MKKIMRGILLLIPLICYPFRSYAYPTVNSLNMKQHEIVHINNISQIDRSFIMRNEGIILYPYKDSANLSTICYGHLVTKFDKVKEHYTMDECLIIFEKDLTLNMIQNNVCLGVPQNDNQLTSVLDFQFNVGARNACNSSLYRDIKSNSISDDIIYHDFMLWSYVRVNGKLVPQQGIIDRRKREANLYNK